jgi:hypothetical protein
MNDAHPYSPPALNAIDNKCPLAEDLQLAPWPPQYRAATPPKYYGDSDPHIFLMCYKAAIALSGGDDATLAKSFIIWLDGATANWYARLHHDPYAHCSTSKRSSRLISKFLSRAQHRRRFLIMCTIWKRVAAWILPNVPLVKSIGPGSIWWSSHQASHNGVARWTTSQPSH